MNDMRGKRRAFVLFDLEIGVCVRWGREEKDTWPKSTSAEWILTLLGKVIVTRQRLKMDLVLT